MKRMASVLGLILGAMCTPLTQAGNLASRVPESTFLFLEWQGSDNIEKSYQGSHLQALAKESSIPAFLNGGIATLVAKAPPYMARNFKPLLFLTDEMKLAWKHPAALYMGNVDKNDTSHRSPQIAFILQAGTDTDALYEKLEPNFTNTEVNAPKLIRNGKEILITIGKISEQEQALLQGTPSTTKSLASNPEYQQTLRQVPKNQALEFFIHGKNALETMTTMGAPQELIKILDDNWDLSGTKAVMVTEGFNGKDWVQTAVIASKPDSHKIGLTAGMADKELSSSQLKLIPSTATIAVATNLDIAATMQDFQQRFEKNTPEDADYFSNFKDQFQQNLGLNLDKDVLQPLSSQWIIYTDRNVGGSALTSVLVINPLRDSATFTKTLQTLEANSSKFGPSITRYLGNRVPASRPSTQPASSSLATTQKAPAVIRHTVVNGVTIYQTGGMISTAWAVANDKLYIALSPSTITAALAYQKSGGKSLLDNPNFQALQKRIVPDGAKPTNLSYVDYAGVVPELYVGASALLMKTPEWMKPEVSTSLLPPLTTLGTEMVPGASFTWVDKDGYHSQSISPVPVLNAVGLPLGLNSTVQNVCAVPAIQIMETYKWRSQYMGENNVRNIMMACQIYAQSHDGRFPEHLAELVANRTVPVSSLLLTGSAKKHATLNVQDDWHKIAQDVDNYSDFIYISGGSNNGTPNTTIVLLAKRTTANNKNSVLVGFADGHSERIRIKQLEDYIEENNKNREDAGLPKIEIPDAFKSTK